MLTRHQEGTWKMRHSNVKFFTGLLFLVTILVLALPAPAAIIFQYETTLDLDLGAVGRSLPTHVSCDPATGEVCVTDTRQTALHVLTAAHVQVMRTSPLASIQWPSSGAIAPDGTLLYVDTRNGRTFTVSHLDIFGEPAPLALEAPGGDWNPTLLTVLPDGDLLTLDPADGRLARHDLATGGLRWTMQVGDADARDTHFGRPALGPDGRIYVPGGEQRRVFIVTADGRADGMFGRFGSTVGRMALPVGVACGPGGTLLVLDRMRAKILVFGTDLAFVSEFGTAGARAGQFYHPADIAASNDGLIYVAQGYLGRVQVFHVFDSQSEGGEMSMSSAAAQVVDRIVLGGAGTDRAAMRSFPATRP